MLKLYRLSHFLLAPLLLHSAVTYAAEGVSASAEHGPTGQRYLAQGDNRLAAASAALSRCQNAHQQGPCDIAGIDGKAIATGTKLRAQVPSQPYPLYLWQFKHGASTVFLAGSIHLLKPGFFPLPPPYEAAFAQSQRLVLEVDTSKISTADMQRKSMQYGMLPAAQSLAGTLPQQAYEGLGKALRDYGTDIQHFQRMKPSLATQQLALFAMMSIGFNPELGLENHFRKQAGNRPILQLESFDFQMELLFNAPLATQVELTTDMLAQLPEFEALTTNLVSAWLNGDDQAFIAAMAAQRGESQAVKDYNRRLIEGRNYTMTDTITGYLNQSGTYFVLVGAAHLIGKEGIPALLQSRGYQGERLLSNHQFQ